MNILKNRTRQIGIFIFLTVMGLLTVSCKTLTVQEFKEKYDTVEVNGEKTDWYDGGSIFSVYYNDTVYKAYLSSPPYIGMGKRYKILIDKNNPEKNNIVLLYKPILLDSVPIANAQFLITDFYKGTNEVWVYYDIIYYENEIVQQGKVFYVDIKYFDTIKKYYEQKTTVFVDVYMAQRLADNHVKVDYKINFQKTEEMKKP